MCKVYLGLGSNQGDRFNFIQQAIQAIEQEIGTVRKSSSYYETEPWGFKDNKCFINQVIEVSTDLSPDKLLPRILLIEKHLGRYRQPGDQQYSSRIIDIDILFYDNQIVSMPNLKIPHPQMHLRLFVLYPMFEIAPDFIHPVINETMQSILNHCTDDLFVKKLSVKEVFARPVVQENDTSYIFK
jgi:2-amino-4-hydroxy-6-hydroxymethyldihydropteridine diphosphokinase